MKSSNATSRGMMAAFVIAALASGVGFGLAAMDGERRRDHALQDVLQPEYVGNDRLAPDFTLNDRSGRPVRLRDYRGKTVVLHFWSSDCPPCIQELSESLPVLDDMVRRRSDVALIMVSVDRDWNTVAPLVPPSIESPMLFDPERRVVERRYGTKLFPETWIIDPHGVIRARFDRTLEWSSAAVMDYVTSFR